MLSRHINFNYTHFSGAYGETTSSKQFAPAESGYPSSSSVRKKLRKALYFNVANYDELSYFGTKLYRKNKNTQGLSQHIQKCGSN